MFPVAPSSEIDSVTRHVFSSYESRALVVRVDVTASRTLGFNARVSGDARFAPFRHELVTTQIIISQVNHRRNI